MTTPETTKPDNAPKTLKPHPGECSGASPCSQIILEYLRKNGETSVANLGRLIRDPMGGQNSNPGTLAASSVLRSLEKRGMVRRRADVGPTHHRTMWRLSHSANTEVSDTHPETDNPKQEDSDG